ncbi:MAG TPA: tail fiber domain-containing protein [Xanthobacteraceae bacterium]|jgi:hypothetical protein
MRRLLVAAAALGILFLSTAAWAVVRETEVTITQDGKPVDGATISLQTEPPATPPPAGTKPRATTPPKAKTSTNKEGKVVVTYDDEKTRDDDRFILIWRTPDGRTGRASVTLQMLKAGKVDIPQQARTPSQPATQAQRVTPQVTTDSGVKYGGGVAVGVLSHTGKLEDRKAGSESALSGAAFLQAILPASNGNKVGAQVGVIGHGGSASGDDIRTKASPIFYIEGLLGFPIPVVVLGPTDVTVSAGVAWARSFIDSPFGSDRFHSWGPTVALRFDTWMNPNATVGLVLRWIDLSGRAHLAPGLDRDVNQDAFSAMVTYTHYMSDARLKGDIAPVGQLPNGLKLYRYRYLWSETEFVGVMAQEVEARMPEAVVRGADGLLRVNYAKLGTRLFTWTEWAGPSLAEMASLSR